MFNPFNPLGPFSPWYDPPARVVADVQMVGTDLQATYEDVTYVPCIEQDSEILIYTETCD